MTPKQYLARNGDIYLLQYNGSIYTCINLNNNYSYFIENKSDVVTHIMSFAINGEQLIKEIEFEMQLNDIIEDRI